MSTALSSARKRRAPPQTPTPPGTQSNVSGASPQTPIPTQGLTLPQVITLVDRRLVILETHMKETLRANESDNVLIRPEYGENSPDESNDTIPGNVSEILDEYNSRFEVLADEIANLKNIVMSLQSYTMDVNKLLLRERIQLMADISEPAEDVAADTPIEISLNSCT